MDDPLKKRAVKLGLLAMGVMAGLGLVGNFLSGNLQWFAWGMALGVLISIGSWYWKLLRPVARPKPLAGAKFGKVQMAAGFAGGLLAFWLMRFAPSHVGWLVAGAAVGFFAMFGVVMSPLF